MVEHLASLSKTFSAAELGDGDIICFQKDMTQKEYVFTTFLGIILTNFPQF